MNTSKNENTIMWWVKLYGWIVLAAGIYGITAAHMPVILGHQWAVCIIDGSVSWPCVLTLHLFDASLTTLLLLFSWYSLKKARSSNLRQYLSYLLFAIMIELVFFCFECVELLWNFHNNAAEWENILISSIAIILLGGFILGAYIHQKIISLTQV